MNNDKRNNDPKTVSSFGDEWVADQKLIGDTCYLFDTYFHIFPWESLPDKAQGFIGMEVVVGSLVAPKVEKLTV